MSYHDLTLLKLTGPTKAALENAAKHLAWSLSLPEYASNFKLFRKAVHQANLAEDHRWRAFVIAENANDCVDKLNSGKWNTAEEVFNGNGRKKLCFLFPGHAAHYPCMGLQLYSTNSVANQAFHACFERLEEQHGFYSWPALLSDPGIFDQPKYALVGTFCLEYALLCAYKSWGIQPDYVLGHYTGELAAALATNLLSLDDALKLVMGISTVFEDFPYGEKMTVFAPEAQVLQLLKRENISEVDVVAQNTQTQTVVAGTKAQMQKFKGRLACRGVATQVLDKYYGSNMKLNQSGLLNAVAMQVALKPEAKKEMHLCALAEMPNLLGGYCKQSSRAFWMELPWKKVDFYKDSEVMIKLGVCDFVEMLPKPKAELSPLIKEIGAEHGEMNLMSEGTQGEEWSRVLHTLGRVYKAGYSVNWDKLGYNPEPETGVVS